MIARNPKNNGTSRLAAFAALARGPDTHTLCVGISMMQSIYNWMEEIMVKSSLQLVKMFQSMEEYSMNSL